jgi:hypothetical protein
MEANMTTHSMIRPSRAGCYFAEALGLTAFITFMVILFGEEAAAVTFLSYAFCRIWSGIWRDEAKKYNY